MGPRELATRWFEEIWNGKNPDRIAEWMAPELHAITEAGVIRGPEDFRRLVYDPLVGAFPDCRVEIQIMVVEGEDVMARWVLHARHLGPFLDLAATGREFRLHGMTWLRVRGGKVIDGADSFNLHGVVSFLQTGVSSSSVQSA